MPFFKLHRKFEELPAAIRVQAVIAVGNADMLSDIDDMMKTGDFETAQKMVNELIQRNFKMIHQFATMHGLDIEGSFKEILTHMHNPANQPPHTS